MPNRDIPVPVSKVQPAGQMHDPPATRRPRPLLPSVVIQAGDLCIALKNSRSIIPTRWYEPINDEKQFIRAEAHHGQDGG